MSEPKCSDCINGRRGRLCDHACSIAFVAATILPRIVGSGAISQAKHDDSQHRTLLPKLQVSLRGIPRHFNTYHATPTAQPRGRSYATLIQRSATHPWKDNVWCRALCMLHSSRKSQFRRRLLHCPILLHCKGSYAKEKPDN